MRRMQELLSTLSKLHEAELDWILGWGGLRWGSTEESIMRMLRQLEKANMIEINDETSKVRYIGGEETKTTKKETPKTPGSN